MAQNPFEIVVESKIDSLPVIGDFIENTLSLFKADPGTIYKVQLAVDEATTNVINYAYPGGIGTLKVSLELAGEEVIITIRDKGRPFDPNTIPPPNITADVEDRKIGGLGFFFIKKLMDGVSYVYEPQEGNKLTMRKKLTSGAGIDLD
jgi:serine/threonine-protein kinase RsbW